MEEGDPRWRKQMAHIISDHPRTAKQIFRQKLGKKSTPTRDRIGATPKK